MAANAAKGVALAAGAAGLGCAVAMGASNLLGGASPQAAQPYPSEKERRDIFDKGAKKWDESVRFDEFVAGIGRARRLLVQQAEGDVLEVAIGTGRNFSYYNSAKVKSITGVDFSRNMLQAADGKRAELHPITLRLKVGSTHKLDFEDCTFDTVVDTFGICSFEAPVEALRELRRVVKEDGQILLLEHGASDWEMVQGVLNRGLCRHVHSYGCYPNRNIAALVREAGLYIEKDERKHFGTTYVLVCRRNPPKGGEDAE